MLIKLSILNDRTVYIREKTYRCALEDYILLTLCEKFLVITKRHGNYFFLIICNLAVSVKTIRCDLLLSSHFCQSFVDLISHLQSPVIGSV